MGSLALAGMISGAGEGAGKMLQTAQAGMIQSELLKERDAMETRRMQLMEQYAVAREGRGEKFQRGMEQERRGAAVIEKATDYERVKETEGRRTDQAKDLRAEIRQEEIDFANNKVADPTYRKSLKLLAEASETDLAKAQTKLAQFKVQHMADDRDREIAKADAATAALIFRDATNEINHLSSQVTKAELNMDTAEADRLRTQIKEAQTTQRSARAKAAELIGIKDEPAAKSKQIVIPPGMEPTGTKKANAEAPAAKTGMIYGPPSPNRPVPPSMTKAGASPEEIAKYERELAAYEAYVRAQGGGLPPAPR